jgi:eukaryotic-like serine/threonine-protein kinase
MPLAVGTRLGPYEILAPIGAGGMGEVYRATDTRLRREVAVKVSAERFSERFEREARAVAALNHPNICTLHDVGPDYLVMELVEGQTLAERIRQGPMPLEEVLPLARQIADALEAAHEKGIVHRDLKPGNVKIRPDETVKVLDFGLAKVGGTPAIHSQDSPTMTVGPTEAGVILGTAAYMAPEQANGKPVDKRADIWAFGVVLYEMLTGEPLFHGETATEVLAAVIKDPPRFDRVPPQAQALLQRCLEKDPKRRLRDIGDAMPLLEAAPPSIAPVPPHGRLWPALAGFFCIVSAALALLHFREKPPAPPDPLRLQLPVPQQIARVQGANALAVSPDGRQVAFYATELGSGNHLWIRALDTVEVRPLPGTAYGPASAPYPPVWSPDGRFLAFESLNKLKKIDLSSGVTQDLCEVTGRIAGGSWNPGGVIVFGNATGPLMQVPADGGAASPLTVLDAARQETADILPAFLPDGLHFLYTRISKTPAENGSTWARWAQSHWSRARAG